MVETRRTVKEAQEWAQKEDDNRRIKQLVALRIHHQKSIEEIDKELGRLVRVEVGLIGY